MTGPLTAMVRRGSWCSHACHVLVLFRAAAVVAGSASSMCALCHVQRPVSAVGLADDHVLHLVKSRPTGTSSGWAARQYHCNTVLEPEQRLLAWAQSASVLENATPLTLSSGLWWPCEARVWGMAVVLLHCINTVPLVSAAALPQGEPRLQPRRGPLQQQQQGYLQVLAISVSLGW